MRSGTDRNAGMATTTLGGNPVNTVGELPTVGQPSPPVSLTKADLTELGSDDLAGKRVVLNIFPSIDTAVCAMSTRKFNELASGLDNTMVICASADLPFALSRFCGAEGLDKVVTGSSFRTDFGDAYGVEMADGRLAGLLARAVVVLDTDGTVLYTHLCAAISDEPDYDGAIAALG